MLDRIDLDGTLEFSWEEMPQFLGELDRLLAVAVDGGERTVLEAVYTLAERCLDDRACGWLATNYTGGTSRAALDNREPGSSHGSGI